MFVCYIHVFWPPHNPHIPCQTICRLRYFSAVKSIKKQHLVEIRSMGNPPPLVKVALESICFLLGESKTDWKSIRSVIIKDNFINTIVNFSTEDIR